MPETHRLNVLYFRNQTPLLVSRHPQFIAVPLELLNEMVTALE